MLSLVSFPVISYLLALFASAILVFCAIYYIIAFDDLKSNSKGPIEQANKLNPIVCLEYTLHGFINILFLVGGQWYPFLANAPLVGYHAYRYAHRPIMATSGIYDPTTIFNHSVLKIGIFESYLKIGFYFFSFFFYLFAMLRTFLEDF